jgi:putative sigma-54 modulation protein
MDIIIDSPGFTASENLKTFVEEKLGKLIHKNDMIVRANVTLYKASESIPGNNYCEIRLEIPGKDLFAKRNSDSFEKAILDTTEVIEKQLKKMKEKLTDHHRHT